MLDFSKSTQTLALIEHLRTASIGETVTYATLSDLIGGDIQGANRHYLTSAIKSLYGDGVAFGTVRGEGVKRMTVEEIPAIGDAAIAKIKRGAKRARRQMGVINGANDVPNDVRVKVNASASLLGVIEHFATGRAKDAAQTVVEQKGTVVPPLAILEALKNS